MHWPLLRIMINSYYRLPDGTIVKVLQQAMVGIYLVESREGVRTLEWIKPEWKVNGPK